MIGAFPRGYFNIVRAITLAALACLAASHANSQTYPSRAVKIVVANPPGGLADIAGRLVGEALREANNQSFVVENQTGGSSVVGYGNVARAAPDGYTLLITTDSQTYMAGYAPNIKFDPINDLQAITIALELPAVVVAAKGVNATTLQELIALIKASPEKFNYASGGTGTINHVAGVLFSDLTGTKMVHIPYQGGGPAVKDVLGGSVQLFFPTPSVIMPFYSAGSLRVLAVAAPRRWKALPDVPTAEEAGLPGFSLQTYAALVAPKGTPSSIINQLYRDLLAAAAKGDFREKMDRLGSVLFLSPEESQKRIVQEGREKTALVRKAGITLE